MTILLWAAALVCAAVALRAGPIRLGRAARERRATRAALPALADGLGAALAAGLSLPLALSEVASALPPPLDAACRRASAAMHLGERAERAIASVASHAPHADVAPLGLILASFARSGGRVRGSLRRCAALLRGRLALEDERAALTAQARLSAGVLIGLPPLAALAFGILLPGALRDLVLDAPLVAFLALALEGVGAAWLWRLVSSGRDDVDLAAVVDAVVVGIEAGLSFPAALAAIAARSPDVAGTPAIRRLLADLALGTGTHAALASFGRAGPAEARIAGLVAASSRLGSPLAELLIAQAEALREEARQRAHARARRLPVLMLFPLAFCVLPALLIVFLGAPLMTLL